MFAAFSKMWNIPHRRKEDCMYYTTPYQVMDRKCSCVHETILDIKYVNELKNISNSNNVLIILFSTFSDFHDKNKIT